MELPTNKKTVLALGNFDGLHIGHMAVINAAKDMAKRLNATPCIVTFKEHPQAILTGKTPSELFTGSVKEEAFKETGLTICNLDFKSLMNMEPEEFVNKIIIGMLNAQGVCCGFNYTFGKRGKGTPDQLRELCEKNNIEFFVAEETKYNNETVSSTRIREEIAHGDIEIANAMLGRSFAYSQLVVDGDKRGRALGTPTINQTLPQTLVEPKHGVYMSKCKIGDTTFYGVTNIGTRPTIGHGPVSSETFILDFDADLYGKYIEVALLSYLRPEMKFSSLDALKTQIHQDADYVRNRIKIK